MNAIARWSSNFIFGALLFLCGACGDGESQGSNGASSSGGAGGTMAAGGAGGTMATGGAGGTMAAGGAGTGGSGGEVIPLGTPGKFPDSATAVCSLGAMPLPCPKAGEAGYGQDGNYEINTPVYVDNAELVTDPITGLMWQKNLMGAYAAKDAQTYCDNLSLGGFDDYRLPSRLELTSLTDHGLNNPALSPLFANAGPSWTRTPYAVGNPANTHWFVNASTGAANFLSDSLLNYARCVRGPEFAGAFMKTSDGVVDQITGLEWQRTALPVNEMDWPSALSYCENLNLGGQSDWRMPSIKELHSLVDDTAAASPVINTSVFGATKAGFYWSATPELDPAKTDAFGVQFVTGITATQTTNSTGLTRCVRIYKP